MATHRLVCLANSIKLGGHCVAGLRVDGKGWIRPISELPEGELMTRQCTCDSGVEVAPLDLIEVEIGGHRPIVNQSENFLVTNTPWKLLARPAPVSLAPVVRKAIVLSPPLLSCTDSRRSIHDFPSGQYAASLALVSPDQPRWEVTTSSRNKMQVRCSFELGSTTYDLAVTDPAWKRRFRSLPFGLHRSSAVGLRPVDRLLLCVSTGEPYGGYCYLLVAAVIVLDAGWRSALLK
jgi:hypothetical protein